MSNFEDGSYGSLTGVALIGKVLAGRCLMNYTKATVGNGTISEEMTPKTMLASAGYVMDAKIAAVSNPVDGECQVTIQIKSDDVAEGFYATNIVLFAEDPDEGEVPYTYLVLENEPEWIRPASSIVGKLATFDLIAAVGSVDTVAAVIDPDAIATIARVEQMIEEHNTDPNAHYGAVGGSGGALVLEVTLKADEWTKEDDSDSYPYYLDLGVEEADESQFPTVAMHKSSLSIAENAALCPTIQTLEGCVRFWAMKNPTSDMSATLVLFGDTGYVGSSSSGYTLPVATASRLGGVKIGDGVTVTEDGTITASVTVSDEAIASDEETNKMLNSLFPDDE